MEEQSHHIRNVSRVVGLYRGLFSVPSSSKLALFAIISSLIYGFIILEFPVTSFLVLITDLLVFALFIFLIPIVVSSIVSYSLIGDYRLILTFRRLIATAVITNIFLGIILLFGRLSMAIFQSDRFLLSSAILGVATIVILRFLAFTFLAPQTVSNTLFNTFIHPILSLLAFTLLKFVNDSINTFLAFFTISIVLLLGMYLYLKKVSYSVEEIVGVQGDALFRSFIKDWFGGSSDDLELLLEEIGEVTSLPISILLFRRENELKSIAIIPSFHPGPFKDVGSSILPYYLSKKLKEQFNCEVLVFHGPSTHAMNLVSQKENENVLSQIKNLLTKKVSFESSATPFVRMIGEEFQIGCQKFNEKIVLIVTRSPKTMEDISLEVSLSLIDAIKSRFGTEIAVIDAHNCLGDDSPYIIPRSNLAKQLFIDGEKTIRMIQNQDSSELKIGIHRLYPDITKEEGLGECGIAVLLIEVAGQRTAYVLFDSNNMIIGLRERIIQNIQGIDEIEVMTSDTHTVNALGPSRSGYHPIGEVVDHKEIISYIQEGIFQASKKIETVEVGAVNGTLQNVKVIGDKGFEKLLDGVARAAHTAKMIFPIIFVALYLLSIIFLFFFFF
jgi:putative membrane protein